MSTTARRRRPGRFPAAPPRDRQRAALLILLGAAATIMLAVSHPAGWVPACPTPRLFGIYCPGCGSLRATHHILNGEFSSALRHNALLVIIGLPLAAWFWCEQLLILLAGRRLPAAIARPAFAWLALALLLLFLVLRNLPIETFETWRPPPL